MELLEKTDFKKFCLKVYFTTLCLFALTVAAGILMYKSAFIQERLYDYDPEKTETVISGIGVKLYSLVTLLALSYYFYQRITGEWQLNKLLPAAALVLALPTQMMFHDVGLQSGLFCLSESLIFISASYFIGLRFPINVARYRINMAFLFLGIMLILLISIVFIKTASVLAVLLPLITVFFGVMSLIEAQRMKQLWHTKITDENQGKFYFSCIANLYFNFIGAITLFDIHKVLFKLIVIDKDDEY